MKLIVGLGNPGVRYQWTPHNLGFWAIDHLCQIHQIPLSQKEEQYHFGEGRICGKKVVLLKPATFMNLSGQAVKKALSRFFKGAPKAENLIVIHDEIDLPLGRIKLKCGGSDAGHRGLQSIREHIVMDFIRLRLGVGRPSGGEEVVDFLLKPFSVDQEKEKAEVMARRASAAIETLLVFGLVKAQNQFHGQDSPTDSTPME